MQMNNLGCKIYGRVLRDLSPYLSDKLYLKLLFRHRVGYSLNLDNPQTYNEKMCWLKVYDHNDLYTLLADKYEVKRFVADTIGEEYVVKSYGVWDSPEKIDYDILPNSFVHYCPLKVANSSLK